MLHPNNKQRTKLFQCFGVSRFTYNWALGRQQENHNNGGKFISAFDLEKEFVQLKKLPEYTWLNMFSSYISNMAIIDACTSYKNFFNGNSDFPKFKSKKKSKPSFYVHNCKIKFTSTHVKLIRLSDSKRKNKRKLNWVKLAEVGRVPTDCKYSNPRVTFDGINFWLSVSIEVEDSTEILTSEGIGIDLGLKDLLIGSDGTRFARPKFGYANKDKLAKEQRKLSKMRTKLERAKLNLDECRNYQKQKRKVAKLYEHIANCAKDFNHKLSIELVRNYDFIAMENLNVEGMKQNHKLAYSIADVRWSQLLNFIQYKCLWYGKEFRQVDRFYASSKICSCCGTVHKDIVNSLSVREWICPDCGTHHDRDVNADKNILIKALSVGV